MEGRKGQSGGAGAAAGMYGVQVKCDSLVVMFEFTFLKFEGLESRQLGSGKNRQRYRGRGNLSVA